MAGELATTSPVALAVPEIGAMSLDQMYHFAEMAAGSGMYGIKTVQSAYTLMGICASEGKNPLQALREYHIMGNGKPTKRADAMLAEFLARGGKHTIEESSHTRCAMTFSFGDTVFESVWTIDDAERAELTTGPNAANWRKYPRNMLRARAVSDGVRTVMPGVVVGIYTPEEEGDMDDKQDGRSRRESSANSVNPAPASVPATPSAPALSVAPPPAPPKNVTPALPAASAPNSPDEKRNRDERAERLTNAQVAFGEEYVRVTSRQKLATREEAKDFLSLLWPDADSEPRYGDPEAWAKGTTLIADWWAGQNAALSPSMATEVPVIVAPLTRTTPEPTATADDMSDLSDPFAE